MEAETSSNDGDAPRPALFPRKPCDACRQRKIRCDRKPPCSHCRAADISCRTSTRAKEERTRITISKQYETKIDGIDDRLARIEKLLRQGSGAHASPVISSKSVRSDVPPASQDDSDVERPVADGIASTGHHRDTLVAQDVLEQTMTSSDGLAQDPQLSATLLALKKIVGQIDRDGRGMTLSQAAPRDTHLQQMPGWDTIEKLLVRGKEHPPDAWELYVLLVPMDEFVSMCESLHRDRRPGSIAQQAIVYAGLYCLVSELAAEVAGDEATSHWNMGLTFIRLAMDTIAQLPLLAPARRDNISALLISSILAIDMAKPHLSWQLNSVSIKMCQTLGYHRAAAMDKLPVADGQRNTFLFWNSYILDRNLALRLGRAPTIPDYDITSPWPGPGEAPGLPKTLTYMVDYWVRVARVQGKICEDLYSPTALLRTQHERAEVAALCKEELERAYEHRWRMQDTIKSSDQDDKLMALDPYFAGDQLMHYSTLALTLQAVAVTPSAKEEALCCARDCLRASTELARLHGRNIYSWVAYIHWVVLHAPMMTPFTAVFSHIIQNAQATTATEDLRLLQDFVATLAPARQLCQGTEKFVQLCTIFCDAAKLYIQLKMTMTTTPVLQQSKWPVSGSDAWPNTNITENAMSVEQFDQVLADMGLATATYSEHDALNTGGHEVNATDSLQDWYNANSSLYNLLDQDFGNFNDFVLDSDFQTF